MNKAPGCYANEKNHFAIRLKSLKDLSVTETHGTLNIVEISEFFRWNIRCLEKFSIRESCVSAPKGLHTPGSFKKKIVEISNN